MSHRRLRQAKARLLGYALVLAVICSTLLSGQRPQAQAAGAFRYGEALQKSILFYEAQQSGTLPSWNRVSWRANATTTDGQAEGVDLSGGWYDAGDHVKFGFPMAFATSMLAWGVVENRDGYVQSGQLSHILNNLRWANDYFINAHPAPNVLYGHVGDVQADHNFWGPPEMITLKGIARPAYKITSTCPGTDLAAETAAAMAASSVAFRQTDPAYADTLLTHAKQLFSFADTTKSADGQASSYINCITVAKDFYNALGEGGWGNPAATKNFWDELVWSAIWLYRATGDTSYLTYARTLYPQMGSQPEPGQGSGTAGVPVYAFGLGWNDKEYANYALMAKLTGEQQYKDDTQRYLDYWTVGYKGTKGKITPGGLAFIFYWASLRMAANTAFVALTYADYLGPAHPLYARYHDFGKRQIDYALGDNPLNRSFMVGFGNNPPLNVHHRAAHGAWQGYMAPEPVNNRHVLTGALVGGPDETDAYADSRTDYVRNEVAVDFNAGITSSLARLYKEYGGAPLADFPVRETPDFEIFAEGSVSQSDSRSSSIQVFITNQSAWPPRVVDKGKIHYFFTLDGATTPAQISVAPSGQSSCPVSGPTQWAGPVYYVTADCSGRLVHPGDMQTYRKSTQFTITSSGSWDPTNDYSYQDIAGAGWSGVRTSKILIDNGAVREWGTPPPGGSPTATPAPSSTPTRTPSATPTRTPVVTPGTPTIPGNLPDLTITRLAISSQTSGCPQGPLGLWVSIANTGTANAGPFTVTANGATQTVAGLAAGQSVSVWLSSYVYGNVNSATVDSANQVAESNEGNNYRSEMVPIPTPLYCPTATPVTPTATPTPSNLPDLTITLIELMPQSLTCPYGPLGLKVWVKNIGAADAGPFVVTGNTTTQMVAGLAAGQQISLWFSSYTASTPNTAIVDSTNQVAESDETNNQRSGMLAPPPMPACPQTPTPPTYTPTPTPAGKVIIEGHIRVGSSSGPGLAGVTVAVFFGSPSGQVRTDANGYYRVELPVPLNQESTSVTPSALGYTFTPPNYAWIITRYGAGTYTRDFVATSATPTPTNTPTLTPIADGPDLTIVSMSIAPQWSGCPTAPLGLSVSVKNIGYLPAGSFAVTANGVAQQVAGLAPGQATSLWFRSFNYTTPNTVVVDSANQVPESDETNNQRSQVLPIPDQPYCPPTVTVTPPTATPTPTGTPTPAPSTLKVQYRAADTSAGDNQIKPHFSVVNSGASAVPLSELTLRYWYTVDGDKAQSFACDYAVVGCGNVRGAFVKLASPRTGADTYLELSFSGTGSIPAGGRSGEIQTRLNKSDWSNYNETGDYSYDPTKTAFADWSKVTLYRNGVLVWGSEP